jgi:hypothetical protein
VQVSGKGVLVTESIPYIKPLIKEMVMILCIVNAF